MTTLDRIIILTERLRDGNNDLLKLYSQQTPQVQREMAPKMAERIAQVEKSVKRLSDNGTM